MAPGCRLTEEVHGLVHAALHLDEHQRALNFQATYHELLWESDIDRGRHPLQCWRAKTLKKLEKNQRKVWQRFTEELETWFQQILDRLCAIM